MRRMQIGQTAAMAEAAASGPAGVRINVQLAVRVAQEIETVSKRLCDMVLATIEPVQSAAAVVLWSQSLVVRSQMVLVEMRSPMAELIGRVIDGSLVSGASGAKLHFWSTSPLAPEITPPRATCRAGGNFGLQLVTGLQNGLEPLTRSCRCDCQPANRPQISQLVPISQFLFRCVGQMRWRLSARKDFFMGEARRKRLQVRTTSTKTRSSP